nr:ras-related protein Rab-3B [Chrysemys picta bellii]
MKNVNFVRLTAANGLRIPMLGCLDVPITLLGQAFPNNSMFVIKDAITTNPGERLIPSIVGMNILKALTGLMPLFRWFAFTQDGKAMVALVQARIECQDTAGQERYRTITTAYYRGAMGFILMYDITSEESFNAVQDWATQIKTYSWDNAQVIVVGNKCDMEDERIIPLEKGKHLADQLGFDYFDASAKENINVRQVFERLVDIICEKMSESIESDPSRGSSGKNMRLTDNPPPLQQNCSC